MKKYNALKVATCNDDRLRGTLQYYGASQTGRWAGRIFQPQNITRGSIKDVDSAIKLINHSGNDLLKACYGDPIEVFSSCLRGMLKAPEGKQFLISDYSGIEARVVQWLAEDERALDVFRRGQDVYKDMASSIFNVAYEAVTKDHRFVGKVAILGLGYQMGAAKFKDTCANFGREIEKDLAETQSQIDRLEKLLSSPFSEKAPEEVVQKERDKLAGYLETAEKLRMLLDI